MRPLRQINFVLGLLLLIGGGGALMVGLRNMVAGLGRGGFDGALGAPHGAGGPKAGRACAVGGRPCPRAPLRRRLPRLFVISLSILVVLLAVHAGYVA